MLSLIWHKLKANNNSVLLNSVEENTHTQLQV
jgi:hypothetical protein